MRASSIVAVLASTLVPALAFAQSSSAPAATSNAPVADAFRETEGNMEKRLVAAAETMPADKYSFKPTPAQMTFGQVVLHVADDNDLACPGIGFVQAPQRDKLTPTDDKDKLVARLKDTFALCDQVFGKLDDSKLGSQVSGFGVTWTQIGLMSERTEDWADHYSQMAIYLRLNGKLPPTARR
jgi:hypothetical protein